MNTDNNKKTLLIFFGELRTFEQVIPHLKNLDKVDVMLSTWNESNYNGSKFKVDENLIRNIYKDIKYCNIIDFNKIENFQSNPNSWKLFYHWKEFINNLENPSQYDKIIFHRCDLLSNWHSILDVNIEDDMLYLHTDNYPDDYPIKNKNAFWVNDYYFFGKFEIVKKFINLLTESDENENYFQTPHFIIWKCIYENNIKIKNFILRGCLIKNNINTDIQNLPPNVSTLSYIIGPSKNTRI